MFLYTTSLLKIKVSEEKAYVALPMNQVIYETVLKIIERLKNVLQFWKIYHSLFEMFCSTLTKLTPSGTIYSYCWYRIETRGGVRVYFPNNFLFLTYEFDIDKNKYWPSSIKWKYMVYLTLFYFQPVQCIWKTIIGNITKIACFTFNFY